MVHTPKWIQESIEKIVNHGISVCSVFQSNPFSIFSPPAVNQPCLCTAQPSNSPVGGDCHAVLPLVSECHSWCNWKDWRGGANGAARSQLTKANKHGVAMRCYK